MAAIINNVTNGVANGSLWTVPVMINRSNKLPLDKYSLFTTLKAAQDYASDPKSMAYVGQILTVATLNDTNTAVNEVTVYVIDKDSTLKEVGKETDLSGVENRLTTIEGNITTIEGDISTINSTLEGINSTWVTGIVNNILAERGYLTQEHQYRIVANGTNNYKLQSTTDANPTEGSWTDVEGSSFSFDYTDMVVSGGSLVDSDGSEEWASGVAGKYLKLTIANGSDIYINVKDLVDVYTADNVTLQLTGGTFSAKTVKLDPNNGTITDATKSALVTGNVLEDYVNYRLGWEVISSTGTTGSVLPAGPTGITSIPQFPG